MPKLHHKKKGNLAEWSSMERGRDESDETKRRRSGVYVGIGGRRTDVVGLDSVGWAYLVVSTGFVLTSTWSVRWA
jgi:hypothetical protein